MVLVSVVGTGAPVPGRARWITRLDELHLLTPLRILLIVVVAAVVTWLVGRFVQRFLRRTLYLPGADRNRAEVRQRAVAGALRSAVIGVVWAAAVITIIAELGVNVGGVLATATIIGGAIAFGAQTLIRDLIAGFFVITEDQYGVGDKVDLGPCTGVVERLTMRSVRLRDTDGKVWHMAHGNVLRVANLSQVDQLMVEIELPRDLPLADADAAITAALDQFGAATGLDPGRLHRLGIRRLTDDRQVHQLAIDARAGEHDALRRAWRRAVLAAAEQRGPS